MTFRDPWDTIETFGERHPFWAGTAVASLFWLLAMGLRALW